MLFLKVNAPFDDGNGGDGGVFILLAVVDVIGNGRLKFQQFMTEFREESTNYVLLLSELLLL